jgi:hypothetical protein
MFKNLIVRRELIQDLMQQDALLVPFAIRVAFRHVLFSRILALGVRTISIRRGASKRPGPP